MKSYEGQEIVENHDRLRPEETRCIKKEKNEGINSLKDQMITFRYSTETWSNFALLDCGKFE